MVLPMVLLQKLTQTSGVEWGARNRLIQKDQPNFEISGKTIHRKKNCPLSKGAGAADMWTKNKTKTSELNLTS